MSVEKNPWTESYWSITAQSQFVEQHGVEKARAAIIEAGLNPDKCPQETKFVEDKLGRTHAITARPKLYVTAPLEEAPNPTRIVEPGSMDKVGLLGGFTQKNAETFEANLDKPREVSEAQASFTRAVCAAQNARNLEARKRVNSPGWKSGPITK